MKVDQRADVDLRSIERQRDIAALMQQASVADVELTIEEVAEMAKMTPRNVRAYQQRRLLPPIRRNGRRLVYSWEHVSRLRLIRALHARGLALKVIEDLVIRGAAEDELARLNQESAPGDERMRVPIGDISTDLLRTADPQLVSDLIDAGVVRLVDGQLVASCAGLGVAGALLGQGVELQAICRAVLLASKAARGVSQQLTSEIAAVKGVNTDTMSLAMRLASITFADTLLDLAEQDLTHAHPGFDEHAHATTVAQLA